MADEQDGFGIENPKVALELALFLRPEDRDEEQKKLVKEHEASLAKESK